ncbi:hypothetical protein GOP47_0018904 [Adiantum capillus-veneris]|uniref:Ycf20-like protein n=1 Tax=Adiantum capillus-veneris TaxID=13818 RepID=A0A9D4ZA34_ADICA|nr:hypothetical protein GOP47_0018904 [Adiantum capillus-veneris]
MEALPCVAPPKSQALWASNVRRLSWGLGTRIKRTSIRALKEDSVGGQRRRLVDVVRLIPAAVDSYFNKSPFRRALWGGISLLGGFYVAQTISLSFGVLGVNDVIAAVLCVLFTEYVTRYYYTRPSPPSFYVALLNNFKMGFSYGLFIDAFKLAS